MKYIGAVAKALVIIGGLNWGFVGLLNKDLVQVIFGGIPLVSQTIYILVGLGAVYMLYKWITKK